MTGGVWVILGFIGSLALTTIGDMVSEEIRNRLDHLPHAILRAAALRLSPDWLRRLHLGPPGRLDLAPPGEMMAARLGPTRGFLGAP